jgi:hypothetical protein
MCPIMRLDAKYTASDVELAQDIILSRLETHLATAKIAAEHAGLELRSYLLREHIPEDQAFFSDPVLISSEVEAIRRLLKIEGDEDETNVTFQSLADSALKASMANEELVSMGLCLIMGDAWYGSIFDPGYVPIACIMTVDK